MKKYVIILTSIILFVVIYLGSAFYLRHEYRVIYDDAVELLNEGKYEEAVARFDGIPNYTEYRDVKELLGLENICPHCGQVVE